MSLFVYDRPATKIMFVCVWRDLRLDLQLKSCSLLRLATSRATAKRTINCIGCVRDSKTNNNLQLTISHRLQIERHQNEQQPTTGLMWATGKLTGPIGPETTIPP